VKLKIPINKLETSWHIFAMLVLSGVFFPLWRRVTIGQDIYQDIVTYTGDPILRYILIGVYVIGILFLVLRTKKSSIKLVLMNQSIWFLVALVFISALWSSVPLLTLRKAVSILFPTVYGVLLAIRYPIEKFTRIILIVFLISIVLSLVFVFLVPSWGLQDIEGEMMWRGIFDQKNRLGRAASLTFLFFLILILKNRPKETFISVLAMLASLVLLIFSRSATSLVLTILLSVVVMYCAFARRVRKDILAFIVISFLLIGIVSVSIISNYESFFALFGKEASLTGRLPLWGRAFTMGLKKPILGYGYSSFWLGWDGPSAYVWEGIHWRPLHGHNGYLDLWLDLGIVGLVILIIIMEKLLYRLFQLLLSVGSLQGFKQYLFHFIFCLFMMVYNVTESVFLQGEMTNAFYWIWIVYLMVALSIIRLNRKGLQ